MEMTIIVDIILKIHQVQLQVSMRNIMNTMRKKEMVHLIVNYIFNHLKMNLVDYLLPNNLPDTNRELLLQVVDNLDLLIL